jgi:hypothetical protein
MNVVHSPFFEKADRHGKKETKCSRLEDTVVEGGIVFTTDLNLL